MPTPRRVERLQKELLRELSAIVRHELNDPRLGLVSLTRVALSKDLQSANVYCSILGGEEEWRRIAGGLRHARGFIRQALGGRLSIRPAPDILFHRDTSIEKSVRMGRLLDDLQQERAARPAPPDGADE